MKGNELVLDGWVARRHVSYANKFPSGTETSHPGIENIALLSQRFYLHPPPPANLR